MVKRKRTDLPDPERAAPSPLGSIIRNILSTSTLFLLGLPMIWRGEGTWMTMGVLCWLVGAVLLSYTVAAGLSLALARFGIVRTRRQMMNHVFAAWMLLPGLMSFGDPQERVRSMAWPLLIGLPLTMYAMAFLFDRFSGHGVTQVKRRRVRGT